MLADSVITYNPYKDTVFIPMYLQKNSMGAGNNVNDSISFRQYIAGNIKDSLVQESRQKSLFTEKTPIIHKDLSLSKREQQFSSMWIFLTFTLLAIILCIFLKFARENIKEYISGCFYKNKVDLSTKNGERSQSLSLLCVLFIFLPITALLLYCTADYFNCSDILKPYRITGPYLFLFLYVTAIILYTVKLISIRFFGWMFKSSKITNYYIQLHYNFNILAGFLLFLPVLSIVYIDNYYLEISLCISWFIIGFQSIARIIKSFATIIATFKFSHFYIFFYLCVVELLPLILLCKLIFY